MCTVDASQSISFLSHSEPHRRRHTLTPVAWAASVASVAAYGIEAALNRLLGREEGANLEELQRLLRTVCPFTLVYAPDGRLCLAVLPMDSLVVTPTQSIRRHPETLATALRRYMSPEEMQRSSSEAMTREMYVENIVYTLGLTMMEIVTGTVVFDGKDSAEAATSVAAGARPDIGMVSQVSPALSAIIARCIHTDHTQRPTLRQLRRMLNALVPEALKIAIPSDEDDEEEDEDNKGTPPAKITHALKPAQSRKAARSGQRSEESSAIDDDG